MRVFWVVAHPSLTGEIEYQVCSLVARGLPLAKASRLTGVAPRTTREWMARGRKDDAAPHWQQFAESVEAARVEHAMNVARRLAELRARADQP